MLLPFEEVSVLGISPLTHDVNSIIIRFDKREKLNFLPGQFITFDLPISEKKRERLRSYSIASPPKNGQDVELIVRKYENGLGSVFLNEKIEIGSKLMARPPQGHLVLPSELNHEMDFFFICTGTGLAPFRSIIHHLFSFHSFSGKVKLIFGCREKKDLIYADEFNNLQKLNPNFQFQYILSREEINGEKGYVSNIYEKIDFAPSPHKFIYLCGWRAMIDEARSYFQKIGFDHSHLKIEIYG